MLLTGAACGTSTFSPPLQVFIRELVSNASNALEKLRHKLLSEGQTLPEMEIHLQTDAEKGTITIQVAPRVSFTPGPGAPTGLSVPSPVSG